MPPPKLPDFSIVIPLWNKRHSITRALHSVQVAARDFHHDIVVVDDGSTDGSGEIVAQIAKTDPHIILIRQENAGVSAARNAGARRARGGHILFLDADDAWLPDHLAEMACLIATQPEAVLYGTGYARVQRGQIQRPVLYGTPTGSGLIPAYFLSMCYGDTPITASSACVPRRIMEESNGFPVGVTHGEDRAFWAEVALRGPVAISDKLTAFYHLDAESRSGERWSPARAFGYMHHLIHLQASLAKGHLRPGKGCLPDDLLSRHLEENIAAERYYRGRKLALNGHLDAATQQASTLAAQGYSAAAAAMAAGIGDDLAQMPQFFPSELQESLAKEIEARYYLCGYFGEAQGFAAPSAIRPGHSHSHDRFLLQGG